MLPSVTISHSVAGRTRLRADPVLQQGDFFARVVRELAALPGVEELSANPRTGSIVVRHQVPLANVVQYAREHHLFETLDAPALPRSEQSLQQRNPRRPPPLRPFERMTLSETVTLEPPLPRARTPASAQTRETVAGIGAMALLGAGVFQLLRGDVLPAALPLLLQAMQVLRRQGPPISFPEEG